MEIVENWAYLIGIIIGVLPSPDRSDFFEVHVKIESLSQVESYPMLAQGSEGETIVVLARRATIDDPDCLTGEPFSARIRAAGPPPLKYFVTPDWSLNK